MNNIDMERYIEIIKKEYPNIHMKTINKLDFERTSFLKKYNLIGD